VQGELGSIEIRRESGFYAGSLRAWQIVVDGQRIGRIREGETHTVDVEAGRHQLWLTVDRILRSQIETVEVGAGELIVFQCWPRAKPGTFLYSLAYQRTQHIRLERISPTNSDSLP
jgi:hypothetical protein